MFALTFIDSSNNKVKIGSTALSGMKNFIQNTPQKEEAGGVLLGRFLIGNNDVVVDHITVPVAGDKRTRFGYFRSKPAHQNRISEAWSSSRGTCNYLGEWHTHPEDDPNPSGHDLANWKNKLNHDKFDGDFLIFIIVGIVQVNAWKGIRDNRQFEKLSPVTYHSSVKAY
jgi:integrative and conjugative element protein (TIGR02256 family)